ncbi:MAG: aminotransferase class V-fold PLP-dependent enzyme, partial [Candidatus Latescibacteria bacterium]|nr:aminotransferase class V-fold PLP-dependent enzyme [Candidatus Latescibacterota bacterium]
MLNLDQIRNEFPVTLSNTYLNHAACSPISTRVRHAMELLLKDQNEFAAIHHSQWDRGVDEARGLVAEFINAPSEQVAFVKNTSEGISFVASGLPWKDGDNVVLNSLEFPANVFPWLNLQSRGVEVRFVEATDGRIATDDIRDALDDRTRVVAMSHIQFGNGYRSDIASVGALCRERGVWFVVDAIQSLGHIKVDLAQTPVDVLTGASYKWLMAPEGSGVFYCSPEIMEHLQLHEIGCGAMAHPGVYDTYTFELAPDARRFECGTPNTIGISGLGAALKLFLEVGMDHVEDRLIHLSEALI